MRKDWLKTIEQVMFDTDAGGGAAVADVGGGDAGDAGGGGDVPLGDDPVTAAIKESVSPAPKVEAKEPTAEEKAEEEALAALEAEVRTKNPAIKGSMDVARHQAVLTRTRNQYEGKLKELNDTLEKVKWAQDPEAEAAWQALQIADKDQRRFAEMLMTDPRFAAILQFKDAQQKAEAKEEAKVPSDRPRPNAKTPDGTMEYYDDEGLAQLLDWHGNQVLTKAEEKLLKKFEDRFGPIESEYKQRNAWNAALERTKGTVEKARATWPGFKDHEAAIGEALRKDQNLSLEEAYRTVVVKALQDQTRVSREKMRQELLEELGQKPKAASASKPGENVERKADPDAPVDIGDIIRRSIRNHAER